MYFKYLLCIYFDIINVFEDSHDKVHATKTRSKVILDLALLNFCHQSFTVSLKGLIFLFGACSGVSCDKKTKINYKYPFKINRFFTEGNFQCLL